MGKGIGCLFIMFSTISFVWKRWQAYKSRLHATKQLLYAIENMSSELATSHTEVAELLRHRKGESDFLDAVLQEMDNDSSVSFSMAWNVIYTNANKLFLPEVSDVLLRFSERFGKENMMQSLCLIRETQKVLTSKIEKNESILPAKKKQLFGLGILFGLGVCVLLL